VAGGKAVFVLGMARSGTSAVARVVNDLGVPVAREDDLMPADEGNPAGYWESLSLTGMNERLLSKLGGSWHSPPAVGDAWENDERLEGLAAEARALLARAHPGPEWVWKDPRNCFTLRFWLRATDARPVVVLVHRDPVEVADSLARRNEFPAALSLALWERYNRAALVSASGLPAFVVRYERLVEDAHAVTGELAAFLRDHGLDVSASAEGVVDRALRRSVGAADPSLDSARRAAVAAALDGLAGAHVALAAPDLPPETGWVEPLLAERRRVLAVDAERRRLEALAGASRLRRLAHRLRP
jgi:hypothetical protein